MTTFIVKKGETDIDQIFENYKPKFSTKNSAKIKYPIFIKAAEFTDDIFWKNVFHELSQGSYKKITKIKEYNLDNIRAFNRLIKPTKKSKKEKEAAAAAASCCGGDEEKLEEGVLFILASSPQISKEYCLIYEDPEKTLKVVKDYMNKSCKVASNTDSTAVHTAMIQQEVDVISSWKSIANMDSKINYIDNYIKRISSSHEQTKRLETILFNLIHTFEDNGIVFKNGKIDKILPLKRIGNEYFIQV